MMSQNISPTLSSLGQISIKTLKKNAPCLCCLLLLVLETMWLTYRDFLMNSPLLKGLFDVHVSELLVFVSCDTNQHWYESWFFFSTKKTEGLIKIIPILWVETACFKLHVVIIIGPTWPSFCFIDPLPCDCLHNSKTRYCLPYFILDQGCNLLTHFVLPLDLLCDIKWSQFCNCLILWNLLGITFAITSVIISWGYDLVLDQSSSSSFDSFSLK